MQINTLTNTLKAAKSNTKETKIERLEQGVQAREEHTSETQILKSRGLTTRDLLLLEPPPPPAPSPQNSTCTSGADSLKCATP